MPCQVVFNASPIIAPQEYNSCKRLQARSIEFYSGWQDIEFCTDFYKYRDIFFIAVSVRMSSSSKLNSSRCCTQMDYWIMAVKQHKFNQIVRNEIKFINLGIRKKIEQVQIRR